MTGTDDEIHDNYGNYQHTNGSVMVFVPKFYYRVANASAPQYATYGANSIEIAGIDQFSDTASANAAGYVLHRAFIDGGSEKSGFFIDKYLNSKSGDSAVSVKNQSPISLTTSTSYNPSSTMTGCTGIMADAVVLGRARGSQYNQCSAFMLGALAILSLAHAQAATGTTACVGTMLAAQPTSRKAVTTARSAIPTMQACRSLRRAIPATPTSRWLAVVCHSPRRHTMGKTAAWPT